MSLSIILVGRVAVISSVSFCLSLFIMLLRMKISKAFDISDYVSSQFSIDLDLKVFKYIRSAYSNKYNNALLPSINYWSFVIAIVSILLQILLNILAVFTT